MNQDLEQAWKQAEANQGKSVDIGRIVVCDSCSVDYTDSSACGGLIFQSKAICPSCVLCSWESLIAKHGEQRLIRARCPSGQSFGDFVRSYRGPNNSVTVMCAPACRDCRRPFSGENVHTAAGWAETKISGVCEDCFDAMFEEVDDE